MAYKIGANKSEQKKILIMHGEGKSSEEIGKILYIRKDVVERFLPKPKAKPKKKAEPKEDSEG